MCIRSILIRCRVFVFCGLGVFLLSAKFESYCDKMYFCYKKYTCEFKSGSIASISLKREDMTDFYRDSLLGYGGKSYVKSAEADYPDYTLSFVILNPRAINIKNVIFDGVEAEPSIFELDYFTKRLLGVKDFQMEPPHVNLKFTEIVFPVPVRSVFTMKFRKPFVDKLKAKDKLKVTLISTYDEEFVVSTDNFIKKYDF
ncbi:hypothetical protein bcCo53_001206 (plasmid) [Borrelia coriaceae]|uniref:Protein BptA n=1 Tax=Borrelia coriaceae ATCC 43381 TaxID=1408429 RepID=W5SVX5_9SPIR|nr:hypothetical protein [Borrelia coriaceae]AHH11085.1 hypothetical protein BCO_0001800 [Borrelia coriaceae ATCC 43381]UPA17037.1 hypothetical protein bcCo53_001206 [Borrelia coriaceae]